MNLIDLKLKADTIAIFDVRDESWSVMTRDHKITVDGARQCICHVGFSRFFYDTGNILCIGVENTTQINAKNIDEPVVLAGLKAVKLIIMLESGQNDRIDINEIEC